MRKLVIALATSAGMGLLATSGTMAAPFGGVAIDTAATAASTVEVVHYRRHRGGWHCPPRRCWRWKCHKVYRTFK